jgi:glycosyltransferase involved in cell wall biosynthesis
MIKILFINPAGYIGGAEKSLLDLVENLPPGRFQPLVALPTPGPLEKALREKEIEVRLLPASPILLGLSRKNGADFLRLIFRAPFLLGPLIAQLAKLIREEEVSLVHTNGIKAHLLGILPAVLTGRPLVWHFRDLPGRGMHSLIFRLFARVFPSRIIANSFAVRKQLGNFGRVRVVYNGVGIRPVLIRAQTLAARKKLGLDEGEIAIGTIGHFAPLKGYDDFLQAMLLILKRVPSSRFLITGEALYPAYRDYRRRLEDQAERMGLAAKVIFTGERRDPAETLAALDIFVLPSRSEGFGRANLEAMAAGLPVVSTDVGGIPEVVIDGETGLLVPPNRPRALAEAIVTLANNQTLRGKMGAAGRKRAEDFSVRKMVDGVTAVYEEIPAIKRRRLDP